MSKAYDSDQASDATLDEDRAPSVATENSIPPMWRTGLQETVPNMNLVNQKLGVDTVDIVSVLSTPMEEHHPHQQAITHRSIDEETASQASTMDGNEEQYVEPKRAPKVLSATKVLASVQEPTSPAPAPYVPGPLESQLAALMSKLIYIEQKQPTISVLPEEFQEMQARLKALEEEKKMWWTRHEAIWALRDEDVENNIKIRVSYIERPLDHQETYANNFLPAQGLLARTRRDLEATQKLREDDLLNVQTVRSKLAEKTRELERVQAQTGRHSPARSRTMSYIERRDTSDLFTAAKVSALEQRTLELEERNSDLLAQLEAAKGAANLDDLNRTTAHEAWKDTVADLESQVKAKDAEIARLEPVNGCGNGCSSISGLASR